MALEISGTLYKKLAVVNGSSAKGAWSKQEFVIETQEAYPRKICMNVWGADKVSELSSIQEGEFIKASINIESREYNQKWYTDIRAWKLEKGGSISSRQPDSLDKELVTHDDIYSENGDSDLPF